ncbi:hypothetical protein [Psychromonas sp. KJ10-2]|uniref:hypothetical protein n=1 Tax=Psychromonas sp. KJ10-2 TaxID=3391822 RepID=UPI0039B67FDD
MAVINSKWIAVVGLIFSAFSAMAHTIYAPNDISLLDNRFRIDPKTEQVTIILNHAAHSQKVVLVKPDGSKWYAQRHPEDQVAWVNNRNQDIITVQNPMPGPWQAIATLNGDNRIQLLSPVKLEVKKLPLKVYQKEFLTTYVSLMNDGKVMTDKDFLRSARLTATLVNDNQDLISLYQDNGEYYDSLPFDGELTTHIFMDLDPGRYLLSVKTKNNIFTRGYNADIVVFPQPITYHIQQVDNKSDDAHFIFNIDTSEIDPNSVIVDGMLTNPTLNTKEQLLIHFSDQTITENSISIKKTLQHNAYTFSGTVFANTLDGREISFVLPEYQFQLEEPEPTVAPTPSTTEVSAPVDTAQQADEPLIEIEQETDSGFQYLWVIVLVLIVLIVITVALVLFFLKRKQKKLLSEGELSLDTLSLDELKPLEMDENKVKK